MALIDKIRSMMKKPGISALPVNAAQSPDIRRIYYYKAHPEIAGFWEGLLGVPILESSETSVVIGVFPTKEEAVADAVRRKLAADSTDIIKGP